MAGAAAVGCSPSLQARATAAQIAMCETRLRMGAIIAARCCSVNLTPVSAGNNVKPAMPIYEYRCTECHTRFSQQQAIEEHGRKRPACPKCKSHAVEQVFSARSEEHTSELQSHSELVCRLLREKKTGCRCRSE